MTTTIPPLSPSINALSLGFDVSAASPSSVWGRLPEGTIYLPPGTIPNPSSPSQTVSAAFFAPTPRLRIDDGTARLFAAPRTENAGMPPEDLEGLKDEIRILLRNRLGTWKNFEWEPMNVFAAEGLAKLGDMRGIATLHRWMKSAQGYDQLTGLSAFQRIGKEPYEAHLEQFFRSETWKHLRGDAFSEDIIWKVAKLGGSTIRSEIERLLERKDIEVGKFASGVLSWNGYRESLPGLRRFFIRVAEATRDSGPKGYLLKVPVAVHLARLGDDSSRSILLESLKVRAPKEMRGPFFDFDRGTVLEAARGLCLLKDPEGRRALERLARHKDLGISCGAIRSLEEFGDPSSHEVLLKFKRGRRGFCASIALLKLGHPNGRALVESFMNNHLFRREAKAELENPKPEASKGGTPLPALIQELENLLTMKNNNAKYLRVSTLLKEIGLSGDPAALPILRKYLKDPHDLQAAWAILEILYPSHEFAEPFW